MTSDNMLKGLFKNEKELFLETLGTCVLIDIGTIESIDDKGRAVVLSNQYVANQRVVYQDAEVIYPGNSGSAYVADCSGSACLILFPYVCMPDTTTRVIRPAAAPYHKDGVKVMPIGNGSQSAVKHFIDTAGGYSVSTTVYTLSFDKETISLVQGEYLSLCKDASGNLYLRQKGNQTGALLFSLDENGVYLSYASADGGVTWEDTIDTDGARTFVQKDGQGQVLNSVTIGTDGKMTVKSASDVSVDANNIKLNGDSKHLVTWESLQSTMTKLYTALTTTAIVGNGSPQVWTGLTSLDISDAKADSLLTGSTTS